MLERAVARHRETLERNPRTDLGAAKARRSGERPKKRGGAKENQPGRRPGALGDAGEIVASAIEPEDEPEGFPSETSRSRTRDEHYWGQALSPERGAQVRAEEGHAAGEARERPRDVQPQGGRRRVRRETPWRIEWGGGASVESPHFQRVHYCELLVGTTSAPPIQALPPD